MYDTLNRRFYGNVSFYKQMVEIFIRTSQESIVNIRSAVKSNDWETVRFLSHNLKGGAANVGAQEVMNLAMALEGLPPQTPIDVVEQFLTRIHSAIQAFQTLPQYLHNE